MNEMNNTPSMATSVVNYILNRFMPYILVASLLFYACGFASLVPYMVLGLMWFSSHFAFGCGVAATIMDDEIKLHKSAILMDRLADEDLPEDEEPDVDQET